MIDWTESYSVEWAIMPVDKDTWDENGHLDGVLSVDVSRDCTDDVPLLETSTMQVVLPINEDFRDGWYRVLVNVSQNGSYERYPITTQLYEATTDEVDYGVAMCTLKGQSVLAPAQEINMRNGSYVPKGANGAFWVQELLSKHIIAPVYVVGDGFTLDQYVVYDAGDSVLSACWNVLDEGKWCLQIDGDGVVYIRVRPDEPELTLGVSDLRLLHPTLKRSRGISGVPNRYIARDGLDEEIAENNDLSSDSSYANVGRWIEAPIDTNPVYVDGESLWAYARRKLEEASTIVRTYDYTREFVPGLLPFDLIRAHASEHGFVGDLRIAKQKLTLDTGITVSETANEVVKLWRA